MECEKREQIYAAAVEEFLDRGYDEASMDRISARAGASKRTVYKHFESKENLFRELMRRHWARFAGPLHVRYDPARDIRTQLVELGAAEGRLLTSAEVMRTTRLVMSEVLRRPDLAEQVRQKTDMQADFAAMLRAASEAGVLRIEDAQGAAAEFIALIKGRAFWPVVFGAPVVSAAEMAEIVECSVDMMMSRYGV